MGSQTGDDSLALFPVASFQLAGNIASLHVATFSGPAAAAVYDRIAFAGERPWHVQVLVLSFLDAKVSLVHFDRSRRRLRTLCLLNFEEHATGPGRCAHRPGLGSVIVVRMWMLVTLWVFLLFFLFCQGVLLLRSHWVVPPTVASAGWGLRWWTQTRDAR